ncbi:MAG: ribosome hibernation-promoting factor, HPF/YfiA family [Mycobacteriales bacterium]
MDIVVKGRNVEVPDHYRRHVHEKLQRIGRFDQKMIRVDVELYHERNPRQAQNCQRVEITAASKGPVVRAEACASDFYVALDRAVEKLENRMRRSSDRRKVHHGSRTPVSVAAATNGNGGYTPPGTLSLGEQAGGTVGVIDREAEQAEEPTSVLARTEGPGKVVRIKEHAAEPMTVDQALHEMELVGHDFFLFMDADTSQPSVVYRRWAYDYGVIRLAK